MVNSIYLEKAVSKKSNNEYFSLVFDMGWSKVRVFVDHIGICSIFDMKVEELSYFKVGDKVELPYHVKESNK